jgi:hypothetical protein
VNITLTVAASGQLARLRAGLQNRRVLHEAMGRGVEVARDPRFLNGNGMIWEIVGARTARDLAPRLLRPRHQIRPRARTHIPVHGKIFRAGAAVGKH